MKYQVSALFFAFALAATTALALEPAKSVFGAEMPAGESQSIAAAITGYQQGEALPQKYAGRVAKVCRKKGCWMELESDGLSARVTMLDYGFFLPTDAQGNAEVFGTLTAVTLDKESAEHYAKDAGTDPALAPLNEFQIVAHSILLTDN